MIALASKLILDSCMSQRIISTQIRQDFLIKERVLDVGSHAPQKQGPAGQLPALSVPPFNTQVKKPMTKPQKAKWLLGIMSSVVPSYSKTMVQTASFL